jgi:hypothetical protein
MCGVVVYLILEPLCFFFVNVPFTEFSVENCFFFLHSSIGAEGAKYTIRHTFSCFSHYE